MRSAKSLLLLACILAGVNAQVRTYQAQQGADCDGSVYTVGMINEVIDSYCVDLVNQKALGNVDHLYRYNMAVNSAISHYYLPLPYVDIYGRVLEDATPLHFAAVQGDCQFQHVAKFKFGPPQDLVVTLANREVCDPYYR
ncbi:CSEP0004 putative effector protein [Blumeria hordei DH14]|uniref:CSEP0004 putative effector protein n=1 Tax=Blumeria graminis f. sp. hordei (strain DH14) TaxID=546991 RepID=N1JCX2_BLUG1|nr:CSEP0004 putative effector protein [Blumeria hordei DH14]